MQEKNSSSTMQAYSGNAQKRREIRGTSDIKGHGPSEV
jgi:hypothetical protein